MAWGMDLLQAEGCMRAQDGLPGRLQGLSMNLLQGQGRVADRYLARQAAGTSQEDSMSCGCGADLLQDGLAVVRLDAVTGPQAENLSACRCVPQCGAGSRLTLQWNSMQVNAFVLNTIL